MAPNSSKNRPLRSGELARLAGVSPDTLRYYERMRLLPTAPRSAAGYRLFSADTLARVQLIRSSLSIGISIRELSGILRERDTGGVPCRLVHKLVGEKLGEVDAQLRDLKSLRRLLRKTLVEWSALLKSTPRSKQARLLEKFGLGHPKSHPRKSPFRDLTRGTKNRENHE